MSEREQWINHPLLMFALGRRFDKLMQRVESKEIRCETLRIVDRRSGQTLAELPFARHHNDPRSWRIAFVLCNFATRRQTL